MSLTVQQMVIDAKKLVNRLKERDSTADALITKSQSVYKLLDAMKQYSEDVSQLNEAARQRPHTVFVENIQQESRHLRQLQQENKELRAALEEHQNALELIMSKYREQTTNLVKSSRINLPELYKDNYVEVIQCLNNKIKEMASVMTLAAHAEDEEQMKTKELVTRLSVENKGLREMLEISAKNNSQGNLISCQDTQ